MKLREGNTLRSKVKGSSTKGERERAVQIAAMAILDDTWNVLGVCAVERETSSIYVQLAGGLGELASKRTSKQLGGEYLEGVGGKFIEALGGTQKDISPEKIKFIKIIFMERALSLLEGIKKQKIR